VVDLSVLGNIQYDPEHSHTVTIVIRQQFMDRFHEQFDTVCGRRRKHIFWDLVIPPIKDQPIAIEFDISDTCIYQKSLFVHFVKHHFRMNMPLFSVDSTKKTCLKHPHHLVCWGIFEIKNV